jgi:hypothetical protein
VAHLCVYTHLVGIPNLTNSCLVRV